MSGAPATVGHSEAFEDQLAKYVEAWEKDWGKLLTAFEDKMGLSRLEAMLYYLLIQNGATNRELRKLVNLVQQPVTVQEPRIVRP